MKIFIFGNPDLPEDALVLRLMPLLHKEFPQHTFEAVDPNEEWEVPEELLAIDVAQGIDRVTVFNDLKNFTPAPRLTMHDFDALANLRYLAKLGKLRKIKIIGVPPTLSDTEALTQIKDAIIAS